MVVITLILSTISEAVKPRFWITPALAVAMIEAAPIVAKILEKYILEDG
jgi:hypothetical protein